jgi:proteasome accessory factor B
MADPLERLTNLLAVLLETKVPLTLDQIFHQMEGQYPTELAGRRGSFERDKAVLRGQGIPLQQTVMPDGGTGYWIDRQAYELGDLGLTEDEKRALQLAVAAVRLGVDWGEDALLKIGTSDGDIPGTDMTAALPSLPALAPLFAAHLTRALTTFTYRGRVRNLEPWGLLAREGFWYVVGFERDAAASRVFRVDRIESDVVVGTEASFVVPDGFDPAEAFSDDPKELGASTSAQATVRVGQLRAQRVENEVGSHNVLSREADGSVTVRVPCGNVDAFRSWLLGLADHAEVIEPPEVRAVVIEWLQHMVGAA